QRGRPNDGSGAGASRRDGHRQTIGVVGADQRVEAVCAAYLQELGSRDNAAVPDRGVVPANPRRCNCLNRCRPTPDVACAGLSNEWAAPDGYLRRAGNNGVWVPGGAWGAVGISRPAGSGVCRRRRIPNDRAGTGDRGSVQSQYQDRGNEQQLSRHGPAMAGDFLRGGVFPRKYGMDTRLRKTCRGVWCSGAEGDATRSVDQRSRARVSNTGDGGDGYIGLGGRERLSDGAVRGRAEGNGAWMRQTLSFLVDGTSG